MPACRALLGNPHLLCRRLLRRNRHRAPVRTPPVRDILPPRIPTLRGVCRMSHQNCSRCRTACRTLHECREWSYRVSGASPPRRRRALLHETALSLFPSSLDDCAQSPLLRNTVIGRRSYSIESPVFSAPLALLSITQIIVRRASRP